MNQALQQNPPSPPRKQTFVATFEPTGQGSSEFAALFARPTSSSASPYRTLWPPAGSNQGPEAGWGEQAGGPGESGGGSEEAEGQQGADPMMGQTGGKVSREVKGGLAGGELTERGLVEREGRGGELEGPGATGGADSPELVKTAAESSDKGDMGRDSEAWRLAEQALQAENEQYLAAEAARVRAEVRAEQTALFQQASRDLLRVLQREWHVRLQEIEREAAALALDVASKVLQQQVDDNNVSLAPVVKTALQQVRDQPRVQVMVPPVHEAEIQGVMNELQAVLAQDSHLEIIVDEEMEPGGCVVHGEQSSVDARFSTRLEAVTEGVAEILGAA